MQQQRHPQRHDPRYRNFSTSAVKDLDAPRHQNWLDMSAALGFGSEKPMGHLRRLSRAKLLLRRSNEVASSPTFGLIYGLRRDVILAAFFPHGVPMELAVAPDTPPRAEETPRTPTEEDIIGSFERAKSLFAEGSIRMAAMVFTRADEMFGKLRFQRWKETATKGK